MARAIERRDATDAEAKALASSVRIRILRLCLDEELSNREIAELMGVSEKSVKLHLTNLVAKFQVRDRLQLVIAAHKAGLIQL